MLTNFLTFSDGAKFALIARNLFQGNGYVTDFSFWGGKLFATSGVPYLLPNVINIFFKIFGVNDLAVIYFSFTFYILLVISVFLLANKLAGKLVGILSALAVAANLNFLDYATSGASETLFAFEIVFAMYLMSFKNTWANLLGFLFLGLMYFSRPQAFIFMAGIFLYWLIVRLGVKRALIWFFGFGLLGVLLDKYVIYPLSFKYPVTPIFARGIQSILTYSSFAATSDGLRGAASSTLTLLDVAKKVFYNLYNFYKAIPEIMNPYMFSMFLVGLFIKAKEGVVNSFKVSTLFMFIITFLVTALTIPLYRYLHPVVPLLYIVAIITLVSIVRKFYHSFSKQVYGPQKVALISIFLTLIFVVGQTVGYYVLDSRFKSRLHNVQKPPIYAVMSYKLKEVTNSDQVVLTNLDTWGSWYGERKTVWFPLDPKMLLGNDSEIDAIYLTSYKIEDDNYRMGDEWKEIFEDPKNQKVLPNYKFIGEYEFNAEDNYDREKGKSVLLVKK